MPNKASSGRYNSIIFFLTNSNFSLDYLIERIWADLGLVKVYTKKRGAHPDLTDPICLRTGATIEVTLKLAIFPI